MTYRDERMIKLRRVMLLVFSLIACAAGGWAMISDGLASPGGAGLAIGAVGFGMWIAGWFGCDEEIKSQ